MMYLDLLNLRLPIYLLYECLALEEGALGWKELAARHYNKHNSVLVLSKLLMALCLYQKRDAIWWTSELKLLYETVSALSEYSKMHYEKLGDRCYWACEAYSVAIKTGALYDQLTAMDRAYLAILELHPHVKKDRIAEVLINAFEEGDNDCE